MSESDCMECFYENLKRLSVNDDDAGQVDDRGRHLGTGDLNGMRNTFPQGEHDCLQCPTTPEDDTVHANTKEEIKSDGKPRETSHHQPQSDNNRVGGARRGKKKPSRRSAKRRRCRRSRNKKLSDEGQSDQAVDTRPETSAKVLLNAPPNTTQYIMEEHAWGEPNLKPKPRRCYYKDRDDKCSSGSSDYSERSSGQEFLQRGFSEVYRYYHVEHLHSMSRDELVQEYLEMERCMARLEEENKQLKLTIDSLNALVITK